LPGRLQQRHVSKSRDAGPVNFIGRFGRLGVLALFEHPPVQATTGNYQHGCRTGPQWRTNEQTPI